MAPSPHNLFTDALGEAGWTVVDARPLSNRGGPNPTRIQLRRGRRALRLLAYAWRITSEGTGRKKAGRTDLDYRVQTTRSHDDDLISEAGSLTVGLGWDEAREVFAAFDPWLKRTTGKSSSVHIARDLLDEAATAGWVAAEREDGPECAFQATEISRFLDWAASLQRRRLLPLMAESQAHDPEGETCEVEVDGRSEHALWVRPRDHIVLVDADRQLVDRSIWQVEDVVTTREQSPGGRQRPHLTFRCRRIGVIRDPDRLVREFSA